MGGLVWAADPVEGHGVLERRFDLHHSERLVPGILWTPQGASGPRPLVLMGHGGTLDKRAPYVLSLARRLVRHHGLAAASIDAPGHGDRVEERDRSADAVEASVGEAAIDQTVTDWRATLDALQTLDEVGESAVGYWGLSLGTILGLPFVAAEPRVRVAVLGLAPLAGPWRDRHARDAVRVSVPVLFLMQWDDELFTRDRVLALFDAIGTSDKRMHVNPGPHAMVPPEEFATTEEFVASRLAPG